MKKIFLMTLLGAFTFAATSCGSDCETCTHPSESTVEVCEKDYANDAAYDLVIATYEASGFTCD